MRSRATGDAALEGDRQCSARATALRERLLPAGWLLPEEDYGSVPHMGPIAKALLCSNAAPQMQHHEAIPSWSDRLCTCINMHCQEHLHTLKLARIHTVHYTIVRECAAVHAHRGGESCPQKHTCLCAPRRVFTTAEHTCKGALGRRAAGLALHRDGTAHHSDHARQVSVIPKAQNILGLQAPVPP